MITLENFLSKSDFLRILKDEKSSKENLLSKSDFLRILKDEKPLNDFVIYRSLKIGILNLLSKSDFLRILKNDNEINDSNFVFTKREKLIISLLKKNNDFLN